MGSVQQNGLSQIASKTVHYNPSYLSSWFESMISKLNHLHYLAIISRHGTGRALGTCHLWMTHICFNHLIHEISTRDAVESTNEERIGYIFFFCFVATEMSIG
ncbi:GRAS family transcription factor family protein [Forsythia ovata]|uniref:GRAS family transcription factor family protein n=1 Tax=Forsythia ovata TaxID=205694 RepID=A0ABD1UYR8_9LAMI